MEGEAVDDALNGAMLIGKGREREHGEVAAGEAKKRSTETGVEVEVGAKARIGARIRNREGVEVAEE